MPVALHDSQRDTSSTRSGISDGQITITDQAGQAELTPGQSIEDIIAGLNREVETGRDTSGSLSNNLDEDEINAKFAIASTFVKETATYITNRGKEVDRAKKALDTEKEKTADERDDALVAQLEQQYKIALIENETWLPGGTGRKVVNALNAAVGGNLSAGATQFVQMGVANYLQQEGATLLGEWTHEGKLTEGSPLHAALHGAVGCLGAAAGGGDCGAGGMGAATSSLLTYLFTDQPNETFAEKETKRDIIVGLTTAMALGTNLDPGTAMNSAVSSVDNNFLWSSQISDWIEEAKNCTPESECVAIDRKYQALNYLQQELMAIECSESLDVCKEKYQPLVFGPERDAIMKLLGEARKDISGFALINIAMYQNAAESTYMSVQTAHDIGSYFDLDPDKVEKLREGISMILSGGKRGSTRRSTSSGHQTHVQANSGNTNTGRHTEQPNSHTTGDVATSSNGVNKPRTSDNASSVGQNETSNHSGVDGESGKTPTLFSNQFPEHPIDTPKIVPNERLKNISGRFNYVIKEDGALVVGKTGHTSLTGGAPVKAAGEIELFNGSVKSIDNASGHFQPVGSSLEFITENVFKQIGINTSGRFVAKEWTADPSLPRGGKWTPVKK